MLDKMMMLIVLLFEAFISKVGAECQTHFTAHEILSSPNKVVTFDDEAGFREMKAKTYSVGKCMSGSRYITGNQFIGNYTLMGHQAALDNDICLVKRIGGEAVYDSMQALVIRTNGWTIMPQSIDLDDLDAQAGVPSSDGWKESMAVFGVQDGTLIRPDIEVYNNTLLAMTKYKIPASAMTEMELDLGDSYVPGGEYEAKEIVNCPFGRDNEESSRCRMTAHFKEPIDTLVILYAVTQKSKNDTNAAVFFSEIVVQCGCRCKQTDAGARKITSGIPGVPNECMQTESTATKTECDILGDMWCSKDDMITYLVTGDQLSNGHFPCTEERGNKVVTIGSFRPDVRFVPIKA